MAYTLGRMDIEKTTTNPSREKLFLLWNSVQRIVSDPTAEDSRHTEDYEIRIRGHYDQLLSNLNVPDVVTQMFQSGKLTAREHEHIHQFYSTPIRASEELLKIIINSRDVYECFLESLKKTKQHHVYQMLTSDEENLSVVEQSLSEHSRLIRQNYECLTESLDPDSGLLTTLYAEEVLNQREFGQIFFVKERFMKNEILLSIISRKSVDDFKKFIIALNDTSQGHIAKRLIETPIGDANQNVATAVKKILSTTCSDSLGKRIPPKPKKQPTASPSSKLMVIKSKPLQKPTIHPSKPNRIEKRQIVTKHEIAKKQSVEYLEEKLRGLPNELQTEVSTKIFLLHRKTSTDNIWSITFTKILEESRNIKRQSIMQAKAADEDCQRLTLEISQREREYDIIKEDIQREKTITKKQLRELQETVYYLEDRLSLTRNEGKNLFDKFKNNEVQVEDLKDLNKRKEQEVNEKETNIEKPKEVEATCLNLKQNLEKKRKEWLEERKQLMKQAQELQQESSDVKVTLFDLKRKFDEERKVWEQEREQLIKQTQELQKELSTEIQDKYKSDPVLVQTIRKKSFSEEENTAIRGLAIIDKELFVVSAGSSEVEVYYSMNFSFSRQWKLKELIDPMDIGSCNKNKCLYIFDCKFLGRSKEILKVEPNGKLIKKWSTGDDWGWGMSITDESNVILTVHEKNKLNEYSSDGQLIREINLSLEAGFSYPWHAIKMTNGHFLVSHGDFLFGDDFHRVCLLDADGKLKKSFGGKCGSNIGLMNCPVYLSVDGNGFVMVTDQENSRVLLLDSDLQFKREILSREKHGLRVPWNILLDESNGRLLVVDNKINNMRILFFEFR